MIQRNIVVQEKEESELGVLCGWPGTNACESYGLQVMISPRCSTETANPGLNTHTQGTIGFSAGRILVRRSIIHKTYDCKE